MRDPEVAELRAFCAAASLGSIAEAARAMGISQPAMSKRLRQLEAVAGEQLFERSARGVTLTSAGERLYGAAKQLLMSADTVHAVISRDTGATVPVRIASSHTIAELRLPEVLADLATHGKGLAAELVTANSDVARALVREGRCDLGIVGLDPYLPSDDELEERVIWRDEIVVLVPHGHAWIDLEEIPAADFARTPLVQRDPWSNSSRIVTGALAQVGLTRAPPAAAIGSTPGLVATARATGIPALLSLPAFNLYAGQDFAIRRVHGLRFDREFALVWLGALLDLERSVHEVARHIVDSSFAGLAGTGRGPSAAGSDHAGVP